ncbi:MAG: RNA polymerase sigma factor [Actinomycetota bacterium]
MFRRESGRAVATLVRLTGDFDLAEEAVQDAFTVAVERWPRDGIPDNPGAWITATARNRAIDRLRRDKRLAEKTEAIGQLVRLETSVGEPSEQTAIADDRLRLIFTCCHPALAPDLQVALTLRTLGGLTTPEIARAFLVPEPTLAQRIVRAKRKIREARIPYSVPPEDLLPERLMGVLGTLYLIFNEGYLASAGDSLIRRELSEEAIRLARVLVQLMPDEPEAAGLLALMLLHDSRRETRVSAEGDLILLEDQDRSRWNRERIDEGTQLVEDALRRGSPGPYQIQAAISAVHGNAETPADTDWADIVALYDALLAIQDTPVIHLNRAVAVAMADGPEAGLSLVDGLAGALDDYHLFYSARADLLRRMDRRDEALAAYERALELTTNDIERRFLDRRIADLGG